MVENKQNLSKLSFSDRKDEFCKQDDNLRVSGLEQLIVLAMFKFFSWLKIKECR